MIGRLAAVALAIVVCAGSADALDPSREMRAYRLDRWSHAEGLHQTYVLTILQTRDGYIWVGSKGGLSRFDGVEFTSFDDRTPGQLGDSEVWAVVEDRDSTLWIGTYGGGITALRGGRFTSLTTRDGLVSDFVTSLCLARDGSLWIGTLDGLGRYRDGRFTAFTVNDGLPHHAVTSLREDRQGRIWIGTRGGLATLDPDRGGIRREPLVRAIGQSIRAISDAPDGSVWVGTSGDGLFCFRGDTVVRYTTRDGLSSDSIGALHVDASGAVWIGTVAGLDRMVGGRIANWQPSVGASPLTNIYALFGDREGNLWIGTASDGLAKLSDGSFVTYAVRDGLPDDSLQSVMEDRHGNVWIGTIAGLSRLNGTAFTNFGVAQGLSSPSVRTLVEDRDGTLWVGTRRGLHYMRNGRIGRITTGGLDLADISVMHVAADGSLWIGTYERGVVRFANGTCTYLARQDGLPGNDIRAIASDRHGNIWIGVLNGGLARLRDGKVTTFTRADGLSNNSVFAVYESRDGQLWVATRGGLHRMRPGRVPAFDAVNGLPASFIYQILEDDRGFTWLTSGQGIFRVSTADLTAGAEGRLAVVPSTRYDTRDGIGSATCMVATQPTAWKSRDGRLWFALIRGLAVTDPASFRLNRIPPGVAIEGVRVDGQPMAVRDASAFPPGTGDVEIHYAGLSFTDPTKVRFRYRLEGRDAAWVDADTRRAAYYTNLAPGAYRFHVSACNNDGVWNETGASLAFTLAPRFYQTRWFAALGLCLLVSAAGAGYQYRVRRLRRSNLELSRLVADRTAELADANRQLRADMGRLERTMTEKTRLEEAIRQSQKMESIGRLAGGVAHDFNNHLTVITGYCEVLLAEIPPEDPRAATVAEILSAGTRAAELTRQLLAFSRKQLMEIRRVNVNDVLFDTERMLRRLIGEDIDLVTALSPSLGAVMADPGQIAQVLTNLVVNARDAMPDGGTITIETENADLDQSAEQTHPEARPGPYVRISVTDTGAGMDPTTIKLIFEPFFTTKEKGRGTGLGLATTYGIVKQSGGFIWVYSEPGRGTTFKIYLPRTGDAAEPLAHPRPSAESLRGQETILLVEDQPEVRKLSATALRGYGYTVLEAANGDEALRVSDACQGPIQLLLTDVVMPGMTGRALAVQLARTRPSTRVLYVSGYTANVIAHQGVLDPGVAYLPKPFTPAVLAAKVREVLEGPVGTGAVSAPPPAS